MERIVRIITNDMTTEERSAVIRASWRFVLVFHILFACGWLTGLGLQGFAKAGEVEDVKQELSEQIQEVSKDVGRLDSAMRRYQREQKQTAMELEIRRLDQEIFNMEARIAEAQQAGTRVDRIYGERLSQLKSERSQVQTRLNNFLRGEYR